MFLPRPFALSLWVTALGLAPAAALAQDETVSTDELKKKLAATADEPPEQGWKATAKVGATFSFNSNENVVGTDDGITVILGGVLSGEANYREGPHLWENSLSIQETQTFTPQLDRFVKSLDQLDLLSTYSYRFESIGWLGVFGRFALNTQIFNGEFVSATDDVEVRRVPLGSSDVSRGGSTPILEGDAALDTGDGFGLTEAFEPLNLRESVGLFADPVKSVPFNLTAKLGAAAQQIISRGGDIVVGTGTDDMGEFVVVRELEDFIFELGVEAELDARGDVVEKVLTYYLTINAFYPPVTTSEVDRSFGDSINFRLKGGISLKLNEAISVDYVLTVLRIPAVTTDFQIQNGILVSAGFDLL